MRKLWLALLEVALILAGGILPLLFPRPSKVTREAFDRIEKGMTRAEVEATLADPLLQPGLPDPRQRLLHDPGGLAQAAATDKEEEPQEVTNSIGMKLVRIPPGKFKMGSPRNEAGRTPDEEQHEVEIRQGFWLGAYEVTQKQFKDVMGYNPSFFSRDGSGKRGPKEHDPRSPAAGGRDLVPADTSAFPVENVSWEEAKEFCDKLSKRPEEKKRGRRYRLPCEAEWEYTCRAASPSYQVFHFGNSLSSRQANFDGRFPYGGAAKGPDLARTCKVGSWKPNGFGLYDMHGNVREWCSDRARADYFGEKVWFSDGQACRVIRGGSWASAGRYCRSACRYWKSPEFRDAILGFRVAAHRRLILPSR
jgi:formylglycine-generating enzyme required for sulfatase activity